MKRAAEIYETCIWLITILIIAAAAAITLPKLCGIQPYIILSSSMEPTIRTGSLIFVNTRDKQVTDGDIVTFTMPNGKDEITVTHRIVETISEGFVTKGDNNETVDLNVLSSDRIVGTYIAGIPRAGYVMSRMSKKVLIVSAAWLFGSHMLGFVFEAIADDDSNSDEIRPKSNVDSR